MNRLVPLLGLLVLGLFPGVAAAHAKGEDYVFLRFEENAITGLFEVNFDDLEETLGLTLERSEAGALASVEASAAQVQAYLLEHFSMTPVGGQPYALTFTERSVESLPQGSFAKYHFEIAIEALPDEIAFAYRQFQGDDVLHRGLVLVQYNAKTDTEYPGEQTHMVFSPMNPEQVLNLNDLPTILQPWDMVPQGVWHIWIGIDHILFLLALMLPTVLLLRKPGEDGEGSPGGWTPVESFKRAFFNLLKIVTVFTVAHSVTLVLAALGFIQLNSALVESVIALSIVLVALNNVFGLVQEGSTWVILGLGLFHGLGFASVMGHLPFRMVDLLKIVIGFNIGVELGQIAIVVVLFPVLFLLRRQSFYVPLVLKGGSLVLAAVAAYWFVERAFGLG